MCWIGGLSLRYFLERKQGCFSILRPVINERIILPIARHCEERSDKAISVEFQVVRDCFAEFMLRNEVLAMTSYIAIKFRKRPTS